jgi:hypothetical protein
MSVTTTVNDAPYTVGNSRGCLVNQRGVSITDYIGNDACSNIMHTLRGERFVNADELNAYIIMLVSLQPPPVRTASSFVLNWSTYTGDMRILYMLRNMLPPAQQHVDKQDAQSMFCLWEATGFNMNLRWDHANHRWVAL